VKLKPSAAAIKKGRSDPGRGPKGWKKKHEKTEPSQGIIGSKNPLELRSQAKSPKKIRVSIERAHARLCAGSALQNTDEEEGLGGHAKLKRKIKLLSKVKTIQAMKLYAGNCWRWNTERTGKRRPCKTGTRQEVMSVDFIRARRGETQDKENLSPRAGTRPLQKHKNRIHGSLSRVGTYPNPLRQER